MNWYWQSPSMLNVRLFNRCIPTMLWSTKSPNYVAIHPLQHEQCVRMSLTAYVHFGNTIALSKSFCCLSHVSTAQEFMLQRLVLRVGIGHVERGTP